MTTQRASRPNARIEREISPGEREAEEVEEEEEVEEGSSLAEKTRMSS